MDVLYWQEQGNRADDGGSGGGNSEYSEDVRMMNAINRQSLRFSNFLLTFSTNVRPGTPDELRALVDWLVESTDLMFHNWDILNGHVLKPAGTDNRNYARFPEDHLIVSVRSRISIEQGEGHGQVHAHIVLEVAHEYVHQRDGAEGTGFESNRLNIGVHTNVTAMREWLNGRIYRMQLPEARKPDKIYVNSRLLTKGTDNSNKWLTLQYIDKTIGRDNNGGIMNMREAEHNANDPNLSNVRQLLLNGGLEQGPNTFNVTPPTINQDRHDAPDFEDSVDDIPNQPASPPQLRAAPPRAAPPPGSYRAQIQQQQHGRVVAPPVAPGVQYTTSTANIGLKRATRGKKPLKFN